MLYINMPFIPAFTTGKEKTQISFFLKKKKSHDNENSKELRGREVCGRSHLPHLILMGRKGEKIVQSHAGLKKKKRSISQAGFEVYSSNLDFSVSCGV